MWLFAFLGAAAAHAACGDSAKNSPLFQAIEACQAQRAANQAGEIPTRVARAGKAPDACFILASDGLKDGSVSKELCRDPDAFVCSRSSKGWVLDSQCRIDNYDQQKNHSSSAVDDRCRFENAKAIFLQANRSKCDAKLDKNACDQHLVLTNKDTLKKIVHKVFYTPPRMAIARKYFDLAKKRYLSLIKKTKRIPEGKKKLLLDRIKLVHLGIDETDGEQGCNVPGPDAPDSGMSLSANTKVTLCPGFMSNIENIEPYTLIESFAHELSHSIDPCSLEEETKEANAAQKFFPKLIECLRGGLGPTGCFKAVLNCLPSDLRLQMYCKEQHQKKEEAAECVKEAKSKPSCFKVDDTEDSATNYATAKKGKYSSDQISESFSDFMGAEVAGSIMQDESDAGLLGPKDKRDAIVSLAASFARLHGTCPKDNSTVDEHPPGYLRMNRLTMGSALFRKAVGCGSTLPPKDRGGQSCSAF